MKDLPETRESAACTAPIFDIQRFSLHDGPGIRTLVFFKGCPMRCQWCQNPESQGRTPVIAFYENKCEYSYECLRVCPENAVRKEGFRIDYDLCTACGKCAEACPRGALKIIGSPVNPEQLMERVLPDAPYFEESGGGITLTGGEATLHSDFLLEFGTLCEKKGLHLMLETSGMFRFEKLERVLEKFDLIYFDLKLMDRELHRAVTGSDNEIIKENAHRLVENRFPVEFRVPLVSGITDTEENLEQTAVFLKILNQNQLHLLKYHNMGEAKINIINGAQPRLNKDNYSEERFGEVREFFSSRGFNVIC